jgi:ornithine carbamoyltransferase
MSPNFQQRLLDAAPLDAADERSLLATARALKRAARGGHPSSPLRGKNIALLCSEPGCACAQAFLEAAGALGARVARIAPEPGWLVGEASNAADTRRLLGRLYDAIGCEETPPGFAQRLHQQVGVPVFQSLGREDHPVTRLVDELADPGDTPAPDDRRYLVQAVLLEAIA